VVSGEISSLARIWKPTASQNTGPPTRCFRGSSGRSSAYCALRARRATKTAKSQKKWRLTKWVIEHPEFRSAEGRARRSLKGLALGPEGICYAASLDAPGSAVTCVASATHLAKPNPSKQKSQGVSNRP